MIEHIWHWLRPRQCLRHAEWHGPCLVCTKCRRIIAMRHGTGGDIRVSMFSPYEKFEQGIRIREDTRQIACQGESLGQDEGCQRKHLCDDGKSRSDDLYSVSGSRERLRKSSEGCESEGARCDCLSAGDVSEGDSK